MTDLNLDGESHAHSLIAAGKVDRSSDWSFSADDGNKLLGSGGDDWANYSKFHLGLDREASEQTKGRYKYPFGKAGQVYRSGIIAVKQRAAQQGDSAVEKSAAALLELIDADKAAAAAERPVRMPFGSIEELRAAMRGNDRPPPGGVKASFDTEVRATDDARTLTFTISTPAVDRMGDTIAVDGWQLESYRKNPVVLWAHDSGSMPPAMAPKIWIEGGKLKADARFVPAEVPLIGPMAEALLQLYKGGFMSATSVGFAPLKYAFTDDPARRYGIDFLEQELLEYSLVPVPANAEALIEGRAAGIDVAPMLDWCEQALARAADSSRIVKLAESVLGGSGADLVALAWAERILQASGKQLLQAGHVQIPRERAHKIAELENAAARQRLARKRQREIDVLRARGK